MNAQGEDVVAGIRTPRDVQEMAEWNPKVLEELREMKWVLEGHFKDMQDLEFTIESGRPLHAPEPERSTDRSGGGEDRRGHGGAGDHQPGRGPPPDPTPGHDPVPPPELFPGGQGWNHGSHHRACRLLPGLPGESWPFRPRRPFGEPRQGRRSCWSGGRPHRRMWTGCTTPQGILTSTGGMTSHAAVVARGWGKCCVVGAGELNINARQKKVTVGGKSFGPEDTLSIDGSTGEVMEGEVAHSQPELSGYFGTVMEWGDEYRVLGIRANADTPEEAFRARHFGATGIGLCRTEHMFFGAGRIEAMQEMILSDTTKARQKALAKLLPYQREDFKGILTAMKGYPVTIRLLDPPLHEFLPREEDRQKLLADNLGITLEILLERVEGLEEANPMLGHRGCRLAITYPEIPVMQVTAIVEAAIACRREGIRALPEIMIPLVGSVKELSLLRSLVEETIQEVMKEQDYSGNLAIPIGTMIEVPRAALTAGEIAEVRRLLLLRNQRPHPDDLRIQSGRHQHLPSGLPFPGCAGRRTPSSAWIRPVSGGW